MMRGALSITNSVCYRLTQNDLTSLLSGQTSDVLQWLHILYDICEELRREGPFRQQIRRYDLTTSSSVNTYPLPGDYWEPIPMTFYNSTNNRRLVGPISDHEFMEYKEGLSSVPYEYVWRIIGFDENTESTEGRQIELYPTPSATESLVIEYVSGNLFIPPNWAPSTVYASGDFVNVNGNIYLCDTNGTSGSTPPSGTDNNQTDGTTQWDYYSLPYETIADDTDTPIFDADLIKLGLKAKWIEANNGAYEKPNFDYNKAKDKSKIRWQGQTRASGHRSSGSRVHRPYVKPGSWSL